MISGRMGEYEINALLAKLHGRRLAKIYTINREPRWLPGRFLVETHLHPLSYPQKTALRIRLDCPPLRPSTTSKEDSIDLFAFLQHRFGDSFLVLVQRTPSTELELPLELHPRGLFDNIKNLERFRHHLRTNVVSGENKNLAPFCRRRYGGGCLDHRLE